MFERMLMSIAERLSPFFSQWTACSQGKPKTHEASCPLPTGNVPTCMCTRTLTYTHRDPHTYTHSFCFSLKSLVLLSVLSFSLSCFKSSWTALGLCWFLCGARPSLLCLWHHTPTPWCVIYLHGGQQDSRGLPHISTEVQGPLKAKPHPSLLCVLCSVPHQGILWENIDYFMLIIVGELWGIECVVSAIVGWGQFIWLRIVITLGFLVRPQAEIIGISISCIQTEAYSSAVYILLWSSGSWSTEAYKINWNKRNKSGTYTQSVTSLYWVHWINMSNIWKWHVSHVRTNTQTDHHDIV